MGLHRQIQIGRPLRLAIYRQLPSAGYRSNKLPSARASVTRIRCPFRSSTDVGYIDKRIVAAAVGANRSASLGRLDVRVFFREAKFFSLRLMRKRSTRSRPQVSITQREWSKAARQTRSEADQQGSNIASRRDYGEAGTGALPSMFPAAANVLGIIVARPAPAHVNPTNAQPALPNNKTKTSPAAAKRAP